VLREPGETLIVVPWPAGLGVDLMVSADLWALMQRIEAHRYRAERLEALSATWSTHNNALAADIAGQWRQVAEQIYALSTGAEIPRVEPLRGARPRLQAVTPARESQTDSAADRLRELEARSRHLQGRQPLDVSPQAGPQAPG
jgi:hypothetical protein